MRRLVVALAAFLLTLPAVVVGVVVLPALPAHAIDGMEWWVDGGWASENDPERPNAEFRVCLSVWQQTLPVTVDYATSDGTATAGADYVATSGQLVFLPMGVRRCQVVEVPILDDDVYESDNDWFGEWFHFDLKNPSAGAPPIGDWGHARGQIEDDPDDWPAAIISDDKVVAEGGTLSVPIRIDWEKSWPVTVRYETIADSASGADFTVASGEVTFEPGETRKYVPVNIADDALNESNETFRVELSDNRPAHKTWIYKGSRHTITDDDPLPVLSIAGGHLEAISDDAARAVFPVTLSAPSGQDVSVEFATADGSAQADTHYTPTSGRLMFPAGATTRTVSVPVHLDVNGVLGKSFSVVIDSATNATLDRTEAAVTIVDPGPLPTPDDVEHRAPSRKRVAAQVPSLRPGGVTGSLATGALPASSGDAEVRGTTAVAAPHREPRAADAVAPEALTVATEGGNDIEEEAGPGGSGTPSGSASPPPPGAAGSALASDALGLARYFSAKSTLGLLGLVTVGTWLTGRAPRPRSRPS